MARKKNKNFSLQDQFELENYQSPSKQPRTLNSIKITIEPRSENQRKLVESIINNPYTLCAGKPGTGKTLLACAEAIKLVQSKESKINKIVLCKSVVQLSDSESVGYLKGSLEDKMDPIIESYMDSLHKLLGEAETNELIKKGTIKVVPIAFLRGRSLSNSLIISDESQNLSINTIHTIMTRMEQSSKMIILGDVKQQDLKGQSGFETILRKFENVKQFGIIRLNEACDVQRHPLINTIEKIFDEIEAEKFNYKAVVKTDK